MPTSHKPAVSRSNRVVIQFHKPSFDDHLSDPVEDRLLQLLFNPPRCFYVNPLVTITNDCDSLEFRRAVVKYRGIWCSRVKNVLGPRVCRSVRNWPRRRRNMSRRDHYLDYALSVPGMLVIDGREANASPGKRRPRSDQRLEHSSRPA